MKVFIVDTQSEVDSYGAAEVARQLLRKPDAVFSFAGGNTTKSFHKTVVEVAGQLRLDFSEASAFTLDEYLGVSRDRPESVGWRITDQILRHLAFRPENIHMLDGLADDPAKACAEFDRLLEEKGIDLQILGIGTNGHIAFNEPGTPFGSVSHVAELTGHTSESKAAMFGGIDKVPKQGISVGIKSTMGAKCILLLAKGTDKAEVMKKTLYGPVTESVPSSVLQLHPDLVVVMDREAASAL